jgi:hypothetical protein
LLQQYLAHLLLSLRILTLSHFENIQNNAAYLDSSAQPDICNGQILDKGLICIRDITKETKHARRLAFLRLASNLGKDTANIITIHAFELKPNNSNVAYKVFIRRIWLLSKSDLPLLNDSSLIF